MKTGGSRGNLPEEEQNVEEEEDLPQGGPVLTGDGEHDYIRCTRLDK